MNTILHSAKYALRYVGKPCKEIPCRKTNIDKLFRTLVFFKESRIVFNGAKGILSSTAGLFIFFAMSYILYCQKDTFLFIIFLLHGYSIYYKGLLADMMKKVSYFHAFGSFIFL